MYFAAAKSAKSAKWRGLPRKRARRGVYCLQSIVTGVVPRHCRCAESFLHSGLLVGLLDVFEVRKRAFDRSFRGLKQDHIEILLTKRGKFAGMVRVAKEGHERLGFVSPRIEVAGTCVVREEFALERRNLERCEPLEHLDVDDDGVDGGGSLFAISVQRYEPCRIPVPCSLHHSHTLGKGRDFGNKVSVSWGESKAHLCRCRGLIRVTCPSREISGGPMTHGRSLAPQVHFNGVEEIKALEDERSVTFEQIAGTNQVLATVEVDAELALEVKVPVVGAFT